MGREHCEAGGEEHTGPWGKLSCPREAQEKQSPYLKDANHFFGNKRAEMRCFGQAHSFVVSKNYDSIHLRFFRLNEFLQRQVDGTDVLSNGVAAGYPSV